jgi:8-oxo-dGTP pyrophosphatase MutT (NUDIX family)
MEAGETEERTAIRETKEEVGLDVEIIDKESIDNNYFLHDGKVLKQVIQFIARPVGSTELKLQAEEVEQARFMSLDEARELADFQYTKITIDEVKERMGL